TWTRTAIRNDAELVDMCAKSEGIVSRKTLLKNHPFVEDVSDEEKELEAEEKAQADKLDPYDDLKDEGGDGDA
ncbi:phage portal protein, partial [Acidaminococcus fermentans]|uniref:phage portal protein n=2 Tax=Acidaminococcus TaxID=904 RepID=UPI003077C248